MATSRRVRPSRRLGAGKGDFKKFITVDPSLRAFSKILGKDMAKMLNDYRPAWHRLLPFLAKGIDRNIKGRGSPIGESWSDRDETYELRKKREGFGRLELVRTGKTIAKLTNPKSKVSLTKRRVSFGTRGKRWDHVPRLNFGLRLQHARPFMGWSGSMLSNADKVMQEHAENVLEKTAKELERQEGRNVG